VVRSRLISRPHPARLVRLSLLASPAARDAREHGIPCVVSVTGATRVTDGTPLHVDGYRGVVTIDEAADPRGPELSGAPPASAGTASGLPVAEPA
jgi:hypothetical protein